MCAATVKEAEDWVNNLQSALARLYSKSSMSDENQLDGESKKDTGSNRTGVPKNNSTTASSTMVHNVFSKGSSVTDPTLLAVLREEVKTRDQQLSEVEAKLADTNQQVSEMKLLYFSSLGMIP